MATMVGTQKDLLSLLNQLLELEYDAIEAYDAAVARVKDATIRTQFESFRSDHHHHVTDVSEAVVQLGGTPATKADVKQILTKGKVVIGALMGDKAVLLAMKTNEDDTNTAYERASARTDLPQNLVTIMQRNLADERRHRAWIEHQIADDRISASPR